MIYLLSYIVCIVAANWALVTFGIIPIGFGLLAPAGVLFAGLTFTFRNLTQQTMGRRYGFLAIAAGAVLSYVISSGDTIPGGHVPVAVASGLTFALSESADALVWTNLRGKGYWTGAMVAGDITGQVIDSIIFIVLAFGAPMLGVLLLGQIVGKWYTLLPAIAFTKFRKPVTA